jgi:hypothetical protein
MAAALLDRSGTVTASPASSCDVHPAAAGQGGGLLGRREGAGAARRHCHRWAAALPPGGGALPPGPGGAAGGWGRRRAGGRQLAGAARARGDGHDPALDRAHGSAGWRSQVRRSDDGGAAGYRGRGGQAGYPSRPMLPVPARCASPGSLCGGRIRCDIVIRMILIYTPRPALLQLNPAHQQSPRIKPRITVANDGVWCDLSRFARRLSRGQARKRMKIGSMCPLPIAAPAVSSRQ